MTTIRYFTDRIAPKQLLRLKYAPNLFWPGLALPQPPLGELTDPLVGSKVGLKKVREEKEGEDEKGKKRKREGKGRKKREKERGLPVPMTGGI